MARATRDHAARTPAQRLRDALQELASGEAAEVPTATALCKLAGVSRNTLYRDHRDVLLDLQRRKRRRGRGSTRSAIELSRLRTDNDGLRRQLNMIAALVDHYFAAWEEGQQALERCERELADLRRDVQPKLSSVRRK